MAKPKRQSKTQGSTPKAACKLSPRHLKGMDMILSGMPLQEVAEQLGVTRQTVSEWKNHHPEFKAKLEELRAEAEDELRHSLPLNDGFMLSNLRKLAAEGNGDTRLKAIQFYFERFGSKAEAEGAGAIPGLSNADAFLLKVMEKQRTPVRGNSGPATTYEDLK